MTQRPYGYRTVGRHLDPAYRGVHRGARSVGLPLWTVPLAVAATILIVFALVQSAGAVVPTPGPLPTSRVLGPRR